MASKKAQLEEESIINNENIMLGNKKIKRPTNYVQAKIAKLILKAELSYSQDKKEIMVAMEKNRTLVPKCISYFVLHNPIKVFLFHRIYWRWLNMFGNQEQFSNLIPKLFELYDARFFFQNLAYLQMATEVEQKTAQMDTKTISQRARSEEQTT